MKIQSDQDKVALATIHMIDKADDWWGMVWGSRNVEEMNWAQFEELFLEKYFPESVQQEMAQEFLSLKQGTITVTQYASHFEALSRYAQGVVATEWETAWRFEWCLNK